MVRRAFDYRELEIHPMYKTQYHEACLRMPLGSQNHRPTDTEDAETSHPLCRLGLEPFSNAIHSSSIDLLRECPRKFLYQERFHLQPKGSYSPALHIGSVFHLAMSYLIEGKPFVAIDEAVAAISGERTQAILDSADALGITPSGDSATSLVQKVTKDTALGLAMCQFVHAEHPWPAGAWRSLGTEVAIQMKWETLVSPIRGALDLIYYNEDSNELWIVDHKTTSFNPLEVSAEYSIAVQPLLYRLLLTSLFADSDFGKSIPGAKLMGVVHNVIRKPTIRQKKDETYPDYLARVGAWYRESNNTDSPHFVRSWVRFTGPAMTPELLLRLREADAAQRARPDLDSFYRNAKACHSFGKTCVFHPLCMTDPTGWGQLVDLRYTVSHRDDEKEDE